MPRIVPQNDTITIELEFFEKLLSLHGDFKLDRSSISEVSTTKIDISWKELRAPGSFIPGLIKSGTYYTGQGKEFGYVSRSKPHQLIIELQNYTYKRLVLGFPTEAHRDAAANMFKE